ncbi:MAG: hypothetical protein AB8G23_20045 [Myxococcota bacterium]
MKRCAGVWRTGLGFSRGLTELLGCLAALAVLTALNVSAAYAADDAGDAAPPPAGSGGADVIERSATRGPVSVELTLRPAEPEIGDVLELSLEVRAEAGVEVLMPEFGEALGRFEIVDFAPSEELDASGAPIARQRYRLQPARSGLQTIPSLRVEFVDRRPGQPATPEGEDAFEILTERITLEVKPILAADAPLELRPPHPDLGRRSTGWGPWWAWLLGILAVAALAAPFVWRAWATMRVQARQRSAYEVARTELDALLSAGLPGADRMDGFYVELTQIVRSYLEDRFALRSPELTTQEFLMVMGRSPDLARSHQQLLRDFLEQADLVKFAGHRPSEEVVAESVAAAERFLEDTRELSRVGDSVLAAGQEDARA